jgi:hypothetical protein
MLMDMDMDRDKDMGCGGRGKRPTLSTGLSIMHVLSL